MSNEVQIVILAAGLGKRMGNKDLPKVLIPFKGKPLIQHLLDAIKESGICAKPVIVVGQKSEQVKVALGSSCTYVFQKEQFGTGHAVMTTREELEGKAEDVMVLYGDHPLITAKTISMLAAKHQSSDATITMAVVHVPDTKDWRQTFLNFGRIIRGTDKKIIEIVEAKDLSDGHSRILEFNPGYYCFKADWLWQNIDKLSNNNIQEEYYLTDLIDLAFSQKKVIATVEISPREALGVNTDEQLKSIAKLV